MALSTVISAYNKQKVDWLIGRLNQVDGFSRPLSKLARLTKIVNS